MTRCSKSLVIKEMQIKTLGSYHYSLIKMIKIAKTDSTKNVEQLGSSYAHCCWECKMV